MAAQIGDGLDDITGSAPVAGGEPRARGGRGRRGLRRGRGPERAGVRGTQRPHRLGPLPRHPAARRALRGRRAHRGPHGRIAAIRRLGGAAGQRVRRPGGAGPGQGGRPAAGPPARRLRGPRPHRPRPARPGDPAGLRRRAGAAGRAPPGRGCRGAAPDPGSGRPARRHRPGHPHHHLRPAHDRLGRAARQHASAGPRRRHRDRRGVDPAHGPHVRRRRQPGHRRAGRRRGGRRARGRQQRGAALRGDARDRHPRRGRRGRRRGRGRRAGHRRARRPGAACATWRSGPAVGAVRRRWSGSPTGGPGSGGARRCADRSAEVSSAAWTGVCRAARWRGPRPGSAVPGRAWPGGATRSS